MLLSWLILTNHCALGLMRVAAKAKVEHDCCHGASREPAREAPAGPQQCCKDIKAALPAPDAKLHLNAEEYVFPTVQILPPEHFEMGLPASLEHGPPLRSVSFAELVLQRSVLSHAPPVFA
jgi:hypothetical protein